MKLKVHKTHILKKRHLLYKMKSKGYFTIYFHICFDILNTSHLDAFLICQFAKTCSAEFWKEKNEQKINIMSTHLVWKEKMNKEWTYWALNWYFCQIFYCLFFYFFFLFCFFVNVTDLHKHIFIIWAKICHWKVLQRT